ncbi:hypothetical protein ACHAWO_001865 [Cyclotella atomus]|jgi:hypothetical protein|uniref:Uncharacterized protein n=1 Tax=Cyclotella atomus TaxID=382360 RepID=A0ABD3NQV0_9STRA
MVTSKHRAVKPKRAEAKKAATTVTKRKTRSSTKEVEPSKSEPISSKPISVLQGLVESHQSIAFIGIMHDNLLQTFRNILEEDPNKRWQKIYVFFPSNGCLKTLTRNYSRSMENMIIDKNTYKYSLSNMLSPVVKDLRFMEYDQLFHCGSYWDWNKRGGFIHISPLTWGANAKICPGMNYKWVEKEPSQEYQVYRDGLEYLLGIATTLD